MQKLRKLPQEFFWKVIYIEDELQQTQEVLRKIFKKMNNKQQA